MGYLTNRMCYACLFQGLCAGYGVLAAVVASGPVCKALAAGSATHTQVRSTIDGLSTEFRLSFYWLSTEFGLF